MSEAQDYVDFLLEKEHIYTFDINGKSERKRWVLKEEIVDDVDEIIIIELKPEHPCYNYYHESGNGSKIRELYYKGKYHCNHAPAVIRYNKDGAYETWFNGRGLHRIDGPAKYLRTDSGDLRDLQWFIDDEEYTEEEYNSEAILDLRASLSKTITKSAML